MSAAAAVARELTKKFEETRRGTVGELARYYEETPPRGEVVLVIAGATPPAAADVEVAARARADALRGEGLPSRDIAKQLAAELGIARNLAYRLAHEAEEAE